MNYSRGVNQVLQKDMTASPEKYPQGYFKDKECRECKKDFKPVGPSHLYCSQGCKDIAFSRMYLSKNYGISYEDYLQLFEKQNNKCKICGSSGFKIVKDAKMLLVVDHCHATGKVRGLLCHNCNRGLGLFKDSTDFLSKAISYLEGATTIPNGSTSEANADGSAQPGIAGDDIV